MRRPLALVSVTALLFVGGAPPGRNAVAQQTGPVFSSSYTDLTKCGSGMTKKEEREITGVFAAGGGLLLMGAAAFGVRAAARLP